VSADSSAVVLGVPIEKTTTTWELVKGVGGAPDRLLPVTTVELIQKATVKAAKSAGIQPKDSYTFTMERRLVGTPYWGSRYYVAAGGYTMSNVVAQELRVYGEHTYGTGTCNNDALNYGGPPHAYNVTKIDRQQNAILFSSGLLHCVTTGSHAARVDNWWPLWKEDQTGPNATF